MSSPPREVHSPLQSPIDEDIAPPLPSAGQAPRAFDRTCTVAEDVHVEVGASPLPTDPFRQPEDSGENHQGGGSDDDDAANESRRGAAANNVSFQAIETERSTSNHARRTRIRGADQHAQGQRRRLLKKKFANKIHAYAVPAYSYYYAPATTAVADPASHNGRDPSPPTNQPHGEGQNVVKAAGRVQQCRRRPPRRLAGRLMEQQRYSLPRCPPYRIPLYDQACFKYIFPNLFKNARRKNKFEIMQLFFLAQMFILAIVNIIMTIVNVFFNDPVSNILPWAKKLTVVVFSIEFGVVALLVAFTLVVVVHAVIVNTRGRASDIRRFRREQHAQEKAQDPRQTAPHAPDAAATPVHLRTDPFAAAPVSYVHRRKNGLVIGTTELAQDCATLITLIGTFSVLRIIGLASPSFAFRRILPVFQNAVTLRDVVKGLAFVVLWLMACLLAFVIIIAKVTQISFAFTASISDWTIVNFVQLLGLLFNLARVDDSYYKETSVLLDAVHQHYSPPGAVREYFSTWSVSIAADVDDDPAAAEDDAELRFLTEAKARVATPCSPPDRHAQQQPPQTDVAESGGGYRGTIVRPSEIVEAEEELHRSVVESIINRSRRSSATVGGGFNGCGALPSNQPAATRASPNGRGKRKRAGTTQEKRARRQQRRHSWKEEVAAQARLTDTPSLLTKLMKALHIPPFMYFTYFDVIYDYHFNSYQRDELKARQNTAREQALAAAAQEVGRDRHDSGATAGKDSKPPQVPVSAHVYSFFNYLAFIFEIDNVQLRRFLQMIHSPLPFYRVGRDSFTAAFIEKDVVGMDMALWRSDPMLKATQKYAMAHPGQFNIAYVCDDRRDVWDSRYAEWAQLQEARNALAMAKDVASGVVDIAEQDAD